jgi:hypothetical protein
VKASEEAAESRELWSKKTYKEVSKRKARKDRIDVLIEVGENAREKNSNRNRGRRSTEKNETEKYHRHTYQ